VNSPHSNGKQVTSRAWLRWSLIVVGFLCYGAYRGVVLALVNRGQNPEAPWAPFFFSEVFSTAVWLAFAPLLLLFAKRVPITAGRPLPRLAAHLALMLVLSVFQVYLWQAIDIWSQRGTPFLNMLWNLVFDGNHTLLFAGTLNNFYKYWIIVGLYFAVDAFRKYRREERHAAALALRAARLEGQLGQARLNALRMQLNPHFLFNSLNTISVLTAEDPAKANRVLLRLSELLRIALRESADRETTLAEELNFVRQYLAIEQARFEDRLRTDIEAAPEVGGAMVPTLILQPLVENAVKHGIAKRADASRILVRARREGGRLALSVYDDGPGPDAVRYEGLGLRLTRERLQGHYGEAFALSLTRPDEGGALARLAIPLRFKGGADE